MRTRRTAWVAATATAIGSHFCALALIITCVACGRANRYTLASDEYGFSVTFPEKPNEVSDKNYEGRPKHLWTVYRNELNDFYSAEATTYKDALPTEDWTPGEAIGNMVGIKLMERRSFRLRSAESGREAAAIATTSLAPGGGGVISTIYIIDGPKLISVTARTRNERDRTAFLRSLTLLR